VRPEAHFETERKWDACLLAAAAFAFALVVIRAQRLSITVDEASTYLSFVWRIAPAHWDPSSNNHLLNTLLMRFFTTAFGLSHLSVRAGGIIGGAIYISAAYSISRMLSSRTIIRLIAFILIVFNPYVFDFLPLARGYSLALGLLLAAIAIAATPGPPIRRCALVSVCLALSVFANFSFAFIDAAILFALGLWIANRSLRSWFALLAPALMLAAILPSWTLLHWPHGELYTGTTSLVQTFRSVFAPIVYDVNPHVANPLIRSLLNSIKPWLFPTLGTLGVLQIALLWIRRRTAVASEGAWRISLACSLAGAVAAALAVHWLAYRFTHLLLPENRTAVYLPPLFTVMILAITTVMANSLGMAWNSRALVALLGLTGFLFLGCSRMSWTREWSRFADVHDAFQFIASCAPAAFADQPVSAVLFAPELNLYRRMYNTPIGEFVGPVDPPPGHSGYILEYEYARRFIEAERLKLVYRGELTTLVVAVRPDAAPLPNTSACAQPPIRYDSQGFSDVGGESPVLGRGTFDDTNLALEYRGGWNSDNQFPNAEHGTVTFSDHRNAFVRVFFNAQSITWVYTKAPNRGKAEVTIDDESRGLFDLYAPEVEWKARTTFGGLKPGDHTFKIRVLGEKSPGAKAAFIDLDALIVE
jgi:hypothetical protein